MKPTVELRPVQEADLELFFQHEHDEEAARRAKFRPRDRERFMNHWRNTILPRKHDDLVRTITVDGAVAGNAVAWTADDGRRYLGYWLGREFWGAGIGTIALGQFLTIEQTRPLYADPFVTNEASTRLLLRNGFNQVDTVDSEDGQQAVYELR